MADQIKVQYNGTNVGKIYLSDIEKRLGLGGAQEGNYTGGQDQHMIWGETLVLQKTGTVDRKQNRCQIHESRFHSYRDVKSLR